MFDIKLSQLLSEAKFNSNTGFIPYIQDESGANNSLYDGDPGVASDSTIQLAEVTIKYAFDPRNLESVENFIAGKDYPMNYMFGVVHLSDGAGDVCYARNLALGDWLSKFIVGEHPKLSRVFSLEPEKSLDAELQDEVRQSSMHWRQSLALVDKLANYVDDPGSFPA